MPSKLSDAIRSEIRGVLVAIDEHDPEIAQLISAALIGFENTARAWHKEIHNGSFSVCERYPCAGHNEQLNKVYESIIAMRKNG